MAKTPLQVPKLWSRGPTPHINAALTVRAYDDMSVNTAVDNTGTPNSNPSIGDDIGMSEAWIDRELEVYGIQIADFPNDPTAPTLLAGQGRLCPTWGKRGVPLGTEGPQGPEGEDGPIGAIGRRGARGPKGPVGPDGVEGWVNFMFDGPTTPQTWTVPGAAGVDPKLQLAIIMMGQGAGENGPTVNLARRVATTPHVVLADAGSTVTMTFLGPLWSDSNQSANQMPIVNYIDGGVSKNCYISGTASNNNFTVAQHVGHEMGGSFVNDASLASPGAADKRVILRGGDPGINGWLTGVGGAGGFGGSHLDAAIPANQPKLGTGIGSSIGTVQATISVSPALPGQPCAIWIAYRYP